MLIKLTSIPIPEVNNGLPQTCFVQSERIISIIECSMRQPKMSAADERVELVRELNERLESMSFQARAAA